MGNMMSDDTKALVARLRRWHSEGGSLTARDAADTIDRLERELAEAREVAQAKSEIRDEFYTVRQERKALAERREKLREALLDVAVEWRTASALRCRVCEQTWVPGSPERHAPGCLAAPKDAP